MLLLFVLFSCVVSDVFNYKEYFSYDEYKSTFRENIIDITDDQHIIYKLINEYYGDIITDKLTHNNIKLSNINIDSYCALSSVNTTINICYNKIQLLGETFICFNREHPVTAMEDNYITFSYRMYCSDSMIIDFRYTFLKHHRIHNTPYATLEFIGYKENILDNILNKIA